MPYNKDLDELVFSESKEIGASRLTVSIYSYNNGPKKIQISRENRDSSENWRFAKLGRLTQDEAKAVQELLGKALGNF